MIERKKICVLITKNPHNLGAHWMIEILLVLYNAHKISRNQDKFVFDVNNYIN